ncbi:hypothetical protein PDR5_20590 [Pseudomonas sp. DR 5-09]|nr:hypothetical protein PDR5_20590 [Pseudomonas sp. DR 5-09]
MIALPITQIFTSATLIKETTEELFNARMCALLNAPYFLHASLTSYRKISRSIREWHI